MYISFMETRHFVPILILFHFINGRTFLLNYSRGDLRPIIYTIINTLNFFFNLLSKTPFTPGLWWDWGN
jgi:hypothetical protein